MWTKFQNLHCYTRINDYYYLIFNDVNVKYPNLRSFYSAITEFGTYIEYSDALAAKLHETATLIIKNHVVKVATKYFGKIKKTWRI